MIERFLKWVVVPACMASVLCETGAFAGGTATKAMSIELDRVDPQNDYSIENEHFRVWVNRKQAPRGEQPSCLVAIDGRECWQVPPRRDGWPSIHIEMKDRSLVGAGLHLRMELDVHDNNADRFRLLYDGEYYARNVVETNKTATGKWKTFVFNLPDASPNGRVEGSGCDTSSPRGRIGASFAVNGKLAIAAIRFEVIDTFREAGHPVATTLEVDMGKVLGPATHKGSGLLHSITATEPGDELVGPLKIRCYRGNQWKGRELLDPALYNRLKGFGVAHFQLVLSDALPSGWHDEDWNIDWKVLEGRVEELMREAEKKGLAIEWDIWNEPSGNKFPDWRKHYFPIHKRLYKKIHEIDPDAVVVGPSAHWFDRGFIGPFLDYAHANDCLPEILSWHEIGFGWESGLRIKEHVEWVKEYMRERGMPAPTRISLNETRPALFHTSPGAAISQFAGIERTPEVESAANSCWGDSGAKAAREKINNGTNESLDGLLTHDTKRPRSVWWAYKAYADIVGNIVAVDRMRLDIPLDGVAGYDLSGDKPVARILCGWFLPKSDTELSIVIRNLDKVEGLAKNGRVHAKVKRIPYTDYRECRESDIVTIIDADVPVVLGKATIVLDGPNVLLPHEACTVELTPGIDD
ncbi:MAG: hypothetical protein ABFR33_10830 [Verrucomicrobiota bacterium]